MKNLIFPAFLLFLISCGNNKPANVDSLKTDSVLRTLDAKIKTADTAPLKDSAKHPILPPVFEGDIVMQVSQRPNHIAFGKACGSKYNHAGMIFIRPKDRMYMVMEMNDTITAVPLREWATRGEGKHIVVMRLKDSEKILTTEKKEQLKKGGKMFRGKKEDAFYSWSDDAIYSTELIWKMYSNATKTEICEPGRLGDIDFSRGGLQEQLQKKYGGTIPKEEKFISPDAIYKSPKLVIVFER